MSDRTIRHRLQKEHDLPARKPLRKPLLTPRMAKKRLEFCQRYRDWTAEDWQKVMFSDESTFLQFAGYKSYVRRPPGSSPVNPRFIQPTVKHPHPLWSGDASPVKGEEACIFYQKALQ